MFLQFLAAWLRIVKKSKYLTSFLSDLPVAPSANIQKFLQTTNEKYDKYNKSLWEKSHFA